MRSATWTFQSPYFYFFYFFCSPAHLACRCRFLCDRTIDFPPSSQRIACLNVTSCQPLRLSVSLCVSLLGRNSLMYTLSSPITVFLLSDMTCEFPKPIVFAFLYFVDVQLANSTHRQDDALRSISSAGVVVRGRLGRQVMRVFLSFFFYFFYFCS